MTTHQEFCTTLRTVMINEHIAVNAATNPVVLKLSELTLPQLKSVIIRYSFFPRTIVEILTNARNLAHVANWSQVEQELTRNIDEECGSETNGVPHAEILLRGLEQALGMHDVRQERIDSETGEFLNTLTGMRRFNSVSDAPFVMGATYALEASAVPELEIVWKVVERYIAERGQVGPGFEGLKKFFDVHLATWEPRHQTDLCVACETYVTLETRETFEHGFRTMMQAMDKWWQSLVWHPMFPL